MDAVEINTSENSRPLPSNENNVGMVSEHQVEICRICLLSNIMMRGLFHVDDVLSLSDKVMSVTSVKMLPGDGLPSHICCDCSDKLELAYKFKMQVEQADNVLRERLDSLNIKEELFFGDVDDNLSTRRHNIGEITEESLLLKNHIHLLTVQKISEGEDDLQNKDVQKQANNVDIEQHDIGKHENKEENENSGQNKKQIQITQNQDLQKINNVQQIHDQDNQQIQEITNEQHNHSFGAQVLQEIMLHEINDQEKIQKLNQTHQMAMYEHNYVAESQTCNITNENHVLHSEQLMENNKEGIQIQQVYNIPKESSPIELTRRSKRKINQMKSLINEDFNQDNYFENLNLSSRLKVHSDKLEKIFFICYLCDKQFLSKEVLKEHMHSHEEVRKTLSFTKNSLEKLEKTPEKCETVPTNLIPLKSPASGKHPNTCPHCGKEYLYIISYNKHLKQHEKSELKEELLPLEVSFHEDEDTLNFHGYNDNTSMNFDNEENKKEDEKKIYPKKEFNKQNAIKYNTCKEEFDTINKLKNHQSKHIIEDIHTEHDLKNDIEQLNIQEKSVKNKEDNEKVNADEVNELLIKKEELRDLKCPHCSLSYAHKKSLARHLESHSGTKYTCKLCHQNFSRKDHLHRHTEQHSSRLKNFKCMQCNKIFGNELTLKSHVLATSHKTTLHGKEYDPNKRVKRVAAKAAQRIIDQIKTDLSLDEFEEDEREKKKDKDFDVIKTRFCGSKNCHTVLKKFQRNAMNFYCATCNQKYASKHTLTKHMEQHVKDENTIKQEQIKNVECRENQGNEDNNDEDDDFESGLDWPTDSHECFTCKKRYSTKKSLLRHQLLHEEPNFECDICNIKFYRKDKLKAHYDKCSEKNPDQVRKCNICGDSFENNEILREHRIKHVTEGILTEEDLREIEPRLEDKNEEKVPRKRRTDIVGLECTECNKRYTSRKGLLRHIQVHEGKKYLCDICPKKFYRREHLKIHVAKHNMIKPYKCPRCTKRFIKEEQLNNHLTKHDRSFKKVKETDTSKRFLCEICSKSFTQSTTLIAHLRAHNGIKPYVCEVCSRPFTTNAYLKMHMRTHTQERPYICQYCSRAFARADTLANHLTTHTGEAKYHCKYCPKNFRRLKSLKEHVFIHTGQRPYACPTCDRRFNNNGSRYAHSKRCKQNALQTRASSLSTQVLNTEHNREQESDQQELQNQLQSQRLHQTTISQAQIIKPQNIKTITITRPDCSLNQQHVMAHQEILMPLILPLTVTLADVGEEVILPEGTKIFTA